MSSTGPEMSNTQSIIVYRNPAEAAFWESGMLIPLFGGLATGFLIFCVLAAVAKKFSGDWRGPSNMALGAAGVAAFAAGVLTFDWLML